MKHKQWNIVLLEGGGLECHNLSVLCICSIKHSNTIPCSHDVFFIYPFCFLFCDLRRLMMILIILALLLFSKWYQMSPVVPTSRVYITCGRLLLIPIYILFIACTKCPQ